ncbi:hypothetical protein KJ865_09145 [Myxococcota bacterium]|nr:hypothetical protein [Myxococcota bacterium]
MNILSEQHAMKEVTARLIELVGVSQSEVRIETGHGAAQHDGAIAVGPYTFLIEWRGLGVAAQVASAIEQVQRHTSRIDGVTPLVAVPFMSEAARVRCAVADVAWLDLSGNARIFMPGLRIMIEGKPNLYKQRGRPSSAFAPKSSRITRWLLMHASDSLTQREIARATDTDEGYTSKIVGKLERDGLILKNTSGALKPRDPDLLLDAWREAYDFSKHQIIRGHVAARSGDALLKQLADFLRNASIEYAATGLAAAWLLDRFAAFRTTTIYLARRPSRELLDSLTFREEERGANVWLVVPSDKGVFHGATDVDNIRCVHPVQVYLDLSAHPERADEAASRLRAAHLNWRTDA